MLVMIPSVLGFDYYQRESVDCSNVTGSDANLCDLNDFLLKGSCSDAQVMIFDEASGDWYCGDMTGGAGGGLTSEEVSDLVGGMVTGNTETSITVTYQDADNTLDFVVSESDPKVGTLSNTKWCTSDGSRVNCGSNAPVLVESDPVWIGDKSSYYTKVESDNSFLGINDKSDNSDKFDGVFRGTMTSDKSCYYNATGTQIICDKSYLESYSESDPLSVKKDGSVSFTNNWDQGAFNLTNADSWFWGKVNASVIQNLPSYLLDLVSDTSPQLGGYLDTNGNTIGSTSDEADKIYLKDDTEVYFGNDQDAYIKWDSANSRLDIKVN